MDTIQLEAKADDARNELDVLEVWSALAKEGIRAELHLLAERFGAANADRHRAAAGACELVDELLYDARAEIKGRFNEADEAISNIEERQLFSARPIQ